jgi:glycerate kinase
MAKKHNVPVIALVGGVGDGYQAVYDHGIDAVVPIVSGPMELDRAMTHADGLLSNAAEMAMRLLRVGVSTKAGLGQG